MEKSSFYTHSSQLVVSGKQYNNNGKMYRYTHTQTQCPENTNKYTAREIAMEKLIKNGEIERTRANDPVAVCRYERHA